MNMSGVGEEARGIQGSRRRIGSGLLLGGGCCFHQDEGEDCFGKSWGWEALIFSFAVI